MITIDAKPPNLSEEAKMTLAAEMRRPANVLMMSALVRVIMEGKVAIALPKVSTGRLRPSWRV